MRIWDILKRLTGKTKETPESDVKTDTSLPSSAPKQKKSTPTTKSKYINDYRNGKTLAEIRSSFAEEANRVVSENHTMNPIVHITAVGALQNPAGMIERKDTSYIEQAISTILEAGIPVSPDVEIDIVNLKDGRDFLAEENKTDAVLICRLFNVRSNNANDYWNGLDGLQDKVDTPEDFGNALNDRVIKPLKEETPDILEDKDFSDPRDQYVTFMQSPHLTGNPNLWGHRIHQSEAKITFASFESMNIGDGFGHPDLSTIHSFEDSHGLFGTENDDELWPNKDKWFSRFLAYTPDLIVRDDFLDELKENDLPREDSLIHSAMEYHNRNNLD